MKLGAHKAIKLRSLKKYSKEDLNTMLRDTRLEEIYKIKCVNKAWLVFKDKFLSVLNKVAPIKEVRIKQQSDPWINSEILHLIDERDSHLSQFKKTKLEDSYTKYTYYRNQVNYVNKKAKAMYFKNNVNDNLNKPKKLWSVLKELGTSKSCKTKILNIGLKINQTICFDKLMVATKFNQFFCSIAENLVKQLPPITGKYGFNFVKKYYQAKAGTDKILTIKPVTEDKVKQMILKLNAFKATGLDGLPAKFLRDSAETVAKPLTYIINLSIECGEFPQELKLAKVVPIYKKKEKTEPGNYRPVSILSIVSKLFEKIVCEQLTEHLDSNNYLYELQSGFRSSYSTDSCLIHLSDYILKQQDKGHYTGMVILDLQKAFDTVNHQILLSKLRAMNVGQSAIKWFESYLGCREQKVDISGTLSESESISCGVPQGSILGPLLFLIYVNDMKAAVKCKLLLYADDSALLTSGSDISEIEATLSRELEAVSEWLTENRLSLHLGKTESILFGSKRRLSNSKTKQLCVTCKGNEIESGSQVTYLGITLDQNLTGASVASNLIRKCTNKLKFLYRNTRNLDRKTKSMLTSALIQCHFDYGCAMWYSGLTCGFKKRLQVVQNKIIKYILDVPARTHVGQREFSIVKLLPVPLRVDQLKLNHMFNIINGSAPEYLSCDITLVSGSGHNTRSGKRACIVPRVNSFGLRSFFYSAIKLWNSLPPTTQLLDIKLQFKTKVKAFLWDKLIRDEQNEYIYY
ncbi:MAG: reverse transcriptase family protein [Reichenbachiella sp.]